MNVIWAFVHHPFADRLGWIILHSLWQGALIGVGFALLRLALRNQSAQARYLAGCVCLALILGTPLLTLLMSPGPMRESNADFSAVLTTSSSLAAESPALPPGVSDEDSLLSMVQAAANFLGQIAPWLTAAWLLGVTLSSCRLLRSFWWVQTIRKRDTDTVDEVLLERLDNFRRRLLISRPVRLLKSALVEVPTVVGWLRPVILLPGSSLAGLTPAQLDAILVHELAHVRRLDYVVNIFQSLIETLMFYHPVVWWISRSVREEREHCCDDLVVRVCGNRVDYARALATLEGLRDEMPQLAFAASGGSLLNRVRRLLGVTGTEESMSARQFGGLALLGIGLLFIVLGIYLNLATPMYRAIARIKVDRDTSAQLNTENGKVTLTVGDPYFGQTVVEVIRSEAVLSSVANNLGLLDEWGKKYNFAASTRAARVIRLLREKLSVRAVPDSTLFEISCLSEKPEEAKRIANAVAEAYRNHHYEKRGEQTRLGIASLEDRLKQQQEIVRKAESEVDRLGLELGIPETVAIANTGSSTIENAPPMLLTAETLRRFEGMRIELEAQLTQQETLLEKLKSMPREKLAYSLSTASPDPVLTSLMEQKTLLTRRSLSKPTIMGVNILKS